MENPGHKIKQGEAGLLTQEQLDELDVPDTSKSGAVEAPTEAPKVEDVDMSFADLGTDLGAERVTPPSFT